MSSSSSPHVSASGARLLFDPALVPSSIGGRLPSHIVVRTALAYTIRSSVIEPVRLVVLTIIAIVSCRDLLYRLDRSPVMIMPTHIFNFSPP